MLLWPLLPCISLNSRGCNSAILLLPIPIERNDLAFLDIVCFSSQEVCSSRGCSLLQTIESYISHLYT